MRSIVLVLLSSLVSVLVTIALVALPAQADPPPAGTEASGAVSAVLGNGFLYQGRLTDAYDNPVPDSTYASTFRLYNVSTGGVALGTSSPSVTTRDGLFSAAVYFDQKHFNGQQLYLSLQVGAGAESAHTPLFAVPYALGLRPGAVITTGTAYGKHALEVWSDNPGLPGASLWAENIGTSGIAFWGVANSSEPAIIASNRSTGALFRGYNGDGGGYEFEVNNRGDVYGKGDFKQDLAFDGLVKAGVGAWCSNASPNIFRSFNNVNGATITISSSGAWRAGECVLHFGFDLTGRYVAASALGQTGYLFPSPGGVTCSYTLEDATILACVRWLSGGNQENGNIMVLVY
jgi:hypothetical protein